LFIILAIICHRRRSVYSVSMAIWNRYFALLGTIAWMNVMFISMLKFDFRDELDRSGLAPIAADPPDGRGGRELITPVLILTFLQMLLLARLAVSFPDARRMS